MSNPPPKEKRFLDAYAKQLAEALLENERHQREILLSPHSQSFTKEDLEDAYLALCYDEPMLKNDSICRQLAFELISSSFPQSDGQSQSGRMTQMTKSKLALSDRFVNGILETTGNHRNQSQTSSKPSPPASLQKENDDYTKSYNGEQIIDNTSASRGYTDLAFASFAKGPLHCCNALLKFDRDGSFTNSNACLKATRSFLGTYNGKEDVANQDGRGDKEEATNNFLNSMVNQNDSVNNVVKQSIQHESKVTEEDLNDDDSMKEIFAPESDPDDFDYGDDRFSSPIDMNSGNFQQMTHFLNVESLCQPKMLTLHEMSHRLKSLLADLSYRRITMSTKLWKELGVSNILSELTVCLLKCLGSKDESIDSLGMMFNSPLITLRDRVLDGGYAHDALDAYLDLIYQLLVSDASNVGSFASTNRGEVKELSPARAVGMSSLASLCSSVEFSGITKKQQRIKIRAMVMKCLDTLTDCVEFVRPKKSEASGTPMVSSLPSWVRVAMAISPIIDFLTGVKSRSDFGSVEDSSSLSLSNSEAQSILQTGLFRELIMLYVQATSSNIEGIEDTTKATAVARQLLLRQILVISAQSQILAKYVSRVPELSSIIYSDDFLAKNMVDALLWLLLFSKIKSAHKGPQMVTRGTVAMSIKDMNENAMQLFVKLCQDSFDCITGNRPDNRILHELILFCNCLYQIPFTVDCWIAVVTEMGARPQAVGALTRIIRALPNLKSSKPLKDKDKPVKHKAPPDETEVDPNTKASIRKGCKSLVLHLENLGTSNLSRISSKTD